MAKVVPIVAIFQRTTLDFDSTASPQIVQRHFLQSATVGTHRTLCPLGRTILRSDVR